MCFVGAMLYGKLKGDYLRRKLGLEESAIVDITDIGMREAMAEAMTKLATCDRISQCVTLVKRWMVELSDNPSLNEVHKFQEVFEATLECFKEKRPEAKGSVDELEGMKEELADIVKEIDEVMTSNPNKRKVNAGGKTILIPKFAGKRPQFARLKTNVQTKWGRFKFDRPDAEGVADIAHAQKLGKNAKFKIKSMHRWDEEILVTEIISDTGHIYRLAEPPLEPFSRFKEWTERFLIGFA